MNLFKSMFIDEPVDLDDINLYKEYHPEWTDFNISKLWKESWRDAGEALVYMQFWNKEWPSIANEQVERVNILCEELMKMDYCDDSEENRIKFMAWRFRFADEVENMC